MYLYASCKQLLRKKLIVLKICCVFLTLVYKTNAGASLIKTFTAAGSGANLSVLLFVLCSLMFVFLFF